MSGDLPDDPPSATGRKRPVRRRPKLNRPNPIDVHVGNRVKLRRTILGISQERLGEKIGLTFQQVQKYERGANRIGASRLWELSQVLDVPVAYFFAEIQPETVAQMNQIIQTGGLAEAEAEPYEADPMARREILELARSYLAIASTELRRRVFELTKSMAAAFNTGEPATPIEDIEEFDLE